MDIHMCAIIKIQGIDKNDYSGLQEILGGPTDDTDFFPVALVFSEYLTHHLLYVSLLWVRVWLDRKFELYSTWQCKEPGVQWFVFRVVFGE